MQFRNRAPKSAYASPSMITRTDLDSIGSSISEHQHASMESIESGLTKQPFSRDQQDRSPPSPRWSPFSLAAEVVLVARRNFDSIEPWSLSWSITTVLGKGMFVTSEGRRVPCSPPSMIARENVLPCDSSSRLILLAIAP